MFMLRVSGLFICMGGIVISCDSGVMKYQKGVGKEEREK